MFIVSIPESFATPKMSALDGLMPRVRVRVHEPARGRAQTDAEGRGDDGAGSEESIGI